MSAAGRVASYITPQAAAAMPPCRQVRSRRGRVVRILPPRDSYWVLDLIARGKPSRLGQAFHQALEAGQVWALKGVEGSRRGA